MVTKVIVLFEGKSQTNNIEGMSAADAGNKHRSELFC